MFTLNKHKVNINIIFSTQTGNSQLAAEELQCELESYGYITNIVSIDEYDFLNSLPSDLFCIFIVSTTGYGEAPTSMKSFWKFIMRSCLDSDSLENVNFTVFGLGDSSYEKFNQTAKILFKRLEQLGATSFFPIGLGDDQHDFGWEGEFDPWMEKMIQTLNKLFNNLDTVKEYKLNLPKYKIEILNNTGLKSNNEQTIKKYKVMNDDFEGIVQVKEDLCIPEISENNKDMDKLIFKLNIKSESIRKINPKPGDISLIYSENTNVNDLISKLGYDELYNNLIELTNFSNDKQENIFFINNSHKINKAITLVDLFKHINFYGIPSRKFCKKIAVFCQDDQLREKLLLFGERSKEGKDEFYRYVSREKRTFYDILYDFGFLNKQKLLSLDIIIDSIGFIKPREFSLSDSYNDRIEIIVGLHKYKTYFGKEKVGFCSNFLSKINESVTVNLKLNKGLFPEIDIGNNYILIATGTGITPLLFFLKERKRLIDNSGDKVKIGNVFLFHGCRLSYYDTIEKDFLMEMHNMNKYNFELNYAFSREGENKQYVQHILEKNKVALDMLNKEKTLLLLIGNSKTLPSAIEKVINKHDSALLNTIKQEGRLLIESW